MAGNPNPRAAPGLELICWNELVTVSFAFCSSFLSPFFHHPLSLSSPFPSILHPPPLSLPFSSLFLLCSSSFHRILDLLSRVFQLSCFNFTFGSWRLNFQATSSSFDLLRCFARASTCLFDSVLNVFTSPYRHGLLHFTISFS